MPIGRFLLPACSAFVSSRASRWGARRCCPRSSATSRAATPPSAAISSIARASSWCVTSTRRPRPATSIASTTGRWAATCASCRTSTCMFPISPPWYGSVFLDNGVVADSLDGLALDAVPPRRRHLAAADPAARSATSAWPGRGRWTRARATPDRRLPRQRRPAFLIGTLKGSRTPRDELRAAKPRCARRDLRRFFLFARRSRRRATMSWSGAFGASFR